MITIREYAAFNQRRYSDPWVAVVDKTTAKIDFSCRVGGYTGTRNKGEAGQLYVINPVENDIYAYGQKDYRGNKSETNYVVFRNGTFTAIEKTELVNALNKCLKNGKRR